ncbi:MAG: restriction endonuclease [Candidatus Pacebacteria bacterium]|nr:restriction endonuclease [Candidatus Paceibacterota bacterium]
MVNIINSLGEKEPFSSKKIYNSLVKSGADLDVAHKITKEIKKEIYSNISTFDIYKLVKQKLNKEEKASALRFDLKYAIKRIGPEGFVFEKYIKRIFEELGFRVINNKMVKGRCIVYEIDFIAKNNEVEYIGECKYRNATGDRVDVNVILKSFAVLDDLRNNSLNKNVEAMVVTNEKFTENAVRYAKCKKIKLLGWKYPVEHGLESIIDERKLYPITILPSFNKNYIDIFVKEDLLLIKNLDKVRSLKKYKIKDDYLKALKEEAKLLIN